jgi:3-methyl-2-oxobutanoate hydroxymethyltransferase
VLVTPDILGLTQGRKPKFAKSYDDLAGRTLKALEDYSGEVHKNEYPDDKHAYHMKSGEIDKLKEILKL